MTYTVGLSNDVCVSLSLCVLYKVCVVITTAAAAAATANHLLFGCSSRCRWSSVFCPIRGLQTIIGHESGATGRAPAAGPISGPAAKTWAQCQNQLYSIKKAMIFLNSQLQSLLSTAWRLGLINNSKKNAYGIDILALGTLEEDEFRLPVGPWSLPNPLTSYKPPNPVECSVECVCALPLVLGS